MSSNRIGYPAPLKCYFCGKKVIALFWWDKTEFPIKLCMVCYDRERELDDSV
jgi:hypothetical protein